MIGLDPYRVPGPWNPKAFADAIEAGMARFAEHSVGVEICLFGLDDVGARVAAVDQFIAELREANRRRPRLQQEFNRAGLP